MQDRACGHGGLRAVGDFTQRLTRTPLARRGFGEAILIAEWRHIVGQDQAHGSLPLKISFSAGSRSDGTLHVRVASGGLATEFRHREPLILQRINGYVGYKAVSRLKLTQGPVARLPARPVPKAPPSRSAAEQQRLAATVALVTDQDLRAALTALGQWLGADLAGEG